MEHVVELCVLLRQRYERKIGVCLDYETNGREWDRIITLAHLIGRNCEAWDNVEGLLEGTDEPLNAALGYRDNVFGGEWAHAAAEHGSLL